MVPSKVPDHTLSDISNLNYKKYVHVIIYLISKCRIYEYLNHGDIILPILLTVFFATVPIPVTTVEATGAD